MSAQVKTKLIFTGLAILWLFAPIDPFPCSLKLLMFPFVVRAIWKRKE